MQTTDKVFTDVTERVKRTAYIRNSLLLPTMPLGRNVNMLPSHFKMFTYKKRSFTDIFTPDLVSSIGDTANRIFLAMNSNFQATELKLAHQQKQLAKKFCSMAIKEKKIARKELYLELRSFKANSLKNFMYNLNVILTTIQLDANFEIVFQLSSTNIAWRIYVTPCLSLL